MSSICISSRYAGETMIITYKVSRYAGKMVNPGDNQYDYLCTPYMLNKS